MEQLIVNHKIRLESIKVSMAPEIFSAIERDREYLKAWLPFVEYTQEIEDTEKFIESLIHKGDYKRDDIYAIWYLEKFAGLIGFKDTDWINKKSELGYWLVKDLQGKGIITHCIKKLVSYSFRKLKLNRIQIKVAVDNNKSAAIPKRLGFHFEGIEREGEFHQNKFLDLEVYSLIKSDLK